MAPPTRTSRARWVDEGLRALAAGGPDAVRIEPLAQRLGVTRGGFHGHFGDRRTFLEALLATWEHRSTIETLERVEARGGGPGDKVMRAGMLTFSDALRPVDLAVRDWARHDPAVAVRLRRVDDQRMAYLRAGITSLWPAADPVAVEARCLLAFSLAIGSQLIGVAHPGHTRDDVLQVALEQLLREP